jgi:hypothetical protein
MSEIDDFEGGLNLRQGATFALASPFPPSLASPSKIHSDEGSAKYPYFLCKNQRD